MACTVTGIPSPEFHRNSESEAFDCDIRHVLYGRGTPWRIFFTVDGDIVQVLHVRHGNRDYWLP
ncbi:MAG: type II toxin-antitoxin system RelE/ParE family toxin [Alphaproteobacteria bacterium]|nr:type II toxin-antitoxin system RelE/ParE family toxin [Alphaproteobacteria bacterium]